MQRMYSSEVNQNIIPSSFLPVVQVYSEKERLVEDILQGRFDREEGVSIREVYESISPESDIFNSRVVLFEGELLENAVRPFAARAAGDALFYEELSDELDGFIEPLGWDGSVLYTRVNLDSPRLLPKYYQTILNSWVVHNVVVEPALVRSSAYAAYCKIMELYDANREDLQEGVRDHEYAHVMYDQQYAVIKDWRRLIPLDDHSIEAEFFRKIRADERVLTEAVAHFQQHLNGNEAISCFSRNTIVLNTLFGGRMIISGPEEGEEGEYVSLLEDRIPSLFSETNSILENYHFATDLALIFGLDAVDQTDGPQLLRKEFFLTNDGRLKPDVLQDLIERSILLVDGDGFCHDEVEELYHLVHRKASKLSRDLCGYLEKKGIEYP